MYVYGEWDMCSVWAVQFSCSASQQAYLPLTSHAHSWLHTYTYLRKFVPFLKPPRMIPVRSMYSVTVSACWPSFKSGAPDSSWISQGLATMLQSVRKIYHSRLQRRFLDMGKMHTFYITRLPCFGLEIRIKGSVISLSFALNTDLKHGDNCAQHEHAGACAERGCEHTSTQ
jgi:hypothetical protein